MKGSKNQKTATIFNSPTITSWLFLPVQVLGSLGIIPLMMEKLSQSEMAMWLTMGTLVALSSISDAGFGNTIARFASICYAGRKTIQKDENDSNRFDENLLESNTNLGMLIGTTKKIYFYIGLSTTIILIILGQYLVYKFVIYSKDPTNLWVCFIVISIYCILTVQTNRWTSIAIGINKVSKINVFKIIIGVVEIISYIFVLYFQPKLIVFCIILLTKGVTVFLYNKRIVTVYCNNNIDWAASREIFDRNLFNNMWKPTWRQGIILVGAYLINYGTSIVISQLPDMKQMNSFLFTKRIIDLLRGVAQTPIYSNINNIYTVIMKRNLAVTQMYISEKITLSLGIMIVSLLCVLSASFFVGAIFPSEFILVPSHIFVIMGISALLEMHHSFHATIYLSTNEFPFVLPSIISGVVILIGGFVFIQYGLTIVLVVQLLVQACYNNWYPVKLTFGILNWNVATYFKDLFKAFKRIIYV